MMDGFDADIDAVVRVEGAFAQGFADYGDTTTTLSESLAEELREADDVHAVYPMVLSTGTVLDPSGEPVGTTGAPQFVMSWHDRPGSGYDLSGRAPNAPEEFVLDTATAQEAGLDVGDTTRIRLAGAEHEFRLSGVFTVAGATGLAGATIVGLDHAVAQDVVLGDTGAVSEFYLVGVEGKSQWQVADSVAPVLDLGTESVPMDVVRVENAADLGEALGFLTTVLLVFAGIAVFVGAFLIVNTFAMLLAQRGRELALLRAVGAGRHQVRLMVLGEAVVVGVVASVAGIIAGYGLTLGILRVAEAFGIALPDTTPVLDAPTMAAGVATGLGVTLVSAYGPIRRATRVPPVAVLRDEVAMPVSSLRGRLVAGLLLVATGGVSVARGVTSPEGDLAAWQVGLGGAAVVLGVALLAPVLSRPVVAAVGAPITLLGVSGRLGRANAMRNPRRTAATASALMVGMTLVTMIAVLSASMAASLDRWIDDELGFDFIAQPDGPNGTITPEAVAELGDVEGVERVLALRFGMTVTDDQPMPMGGIAGDEVEEAWDLRMVDGSPPERDTQFAAREDVADAHGWRTGEEVEFRFPTGASAELELTGRYEPSDVYPLPVLLDTSGYAEHFDEELTAFAYLDTAGPAGTELRDELNSVADAHSGLGLMDRGELKEFYGDQLASLTNLVYVMLAMSVVIAALGIVNTLALATAERTREIGLLRAVGLARWQLRRMVRLEATVIAAFGALTGVAVGLGFGWAFQQILVDLREFSVPTGQLATLLVLGVGIGVVAAVWPAWRAARMNVLRAISAE
ncbi:ABC transporter permease [Spiractinospora alimapuensis]|uniref:ABC transporter permease n=1 Tax=Spiractinospora alimapuensis TaxID=2820884 RepID=UPI001F3A20D7|nr:ABC transporter permease [Spiractinospora alimapuensis]QVQ52510.1 ABC transporter permease [Spiractinospora alimapuensis]